MNRYDKVMNFEKMEFFKLKSLKSGFLYTGKNYLFFFKILFNRFFLELNKRMICLLVIQS